MKRRWLGGLTALLLVLTAVFPAGWGGVRAEEAPEALPQTVVSADSRSYDQYRALNADQPAGTRTVTVPLSTGQPTRRRGSRWQTVGTARTKRCCGIMLPVRSPGRCR